MPGRFQRLRDLWTLLRAGKFARNVGVLTLAKVGTTALLAVQGIVVARLLGPADYGLVALLITYPNLVHTFFDTRSITASIKYMAQFTAQGQPSGALAVAKMGYLLDHGVALVAFLAILFTAPWAARTIVGRPELADLIVFYALAFIPRALEGTSRAALDTFGLFRLTAQVRIAVTFVRAAMIIGFVLLGYGVAGVVWGHMVGMSLSGYVFAVLGHVQIRRRWGASWWRARWEALSGHLSEIRSFLGYNILAGSITVFPKQMDIILLGMYRSTDEVGVYRLAKSLASVVGNLVVPLETVTYPRLATIWGRNDRHAFVSEVRRIVVFVALPAGLLCLLCIPALPFLVPLIAGAEYVKAIGLTEVFFVGSALWVALYWLRIVLMTMGEVKFLTLKSVLESVFILGALFLVVPDWGSLGAAWAVIVGGVLGGYLPMALFLRWKTKEVLESGR